MTKPIDSTVEGTVHHLADRDSRSTGPSGGDDATAGGISRAPGVDEGVQSLAQLKRNAVSTPEFDAERVAWLRQAVSSGHYRVNACSVAEKLLAMESKLP